jgi:hypothetical protein
MLSSAGLGEINRRTLIIGKDSGFFLLVGQGNNHCEGLFAVHLHHFFVSILSKKKGARLRLNSPLN